MNAYCPALMDFLLERIHCGFLLSKLLLVWALPSANCSMK